MLLQLSTNLQNPNLAAPKPESSGNYSTSSVSKLAESFEPRDTTEGGKGNLQVITPPRRGSSPATENSFNGDDDILCKHQTAIRFFNDHLSTDEGYANGFEIAKYLREQGFLQGDPRFKTLYTSLIENPDDDDEHPQFKAKITIDEFLSIMSKSGQAVVLERAFRKDLAIPEFAEFCNKIKEIFKEVKAEVSETQGAPASYIPQLGKVDPKLFGLSICTVDGQRFHYGDHSRTFCVQSCCKPLNYCIALEENGPIKVSEHIGREPSGVAFNSLCLNGKNLPHNPYINSGAIMTCSLIKPEKPLFERFEFIMDKYKELSGDQAWGFSNPVYLSEKDTADNNFCLAYMMRKYGAFPANTSLEQTLDFYFQCCSMETDCSRVAVAGATIANGGLNPLTNKQIFNQQTCRDCLSLMYSCGMYDYSGEWAFSIGIPAKSGVSGCIYGIIPNLCCITIYAPPLDSVGNSVRGVEFFKRLVKVFVLHNFDTVQGGLDQKKLINPRKSFKSDREGKVAALFAAAEGDLSELKRLLVSGVPATIADYDGRTLLHLACCEGHLPIVRHLIKFHPTVDVFAKDRWNGTPYSDALKHKNFDIIRFLQKHGYKEPNEKETTTTTE